MAVVACEAIEQPSRSTTASDSTTKTLILDAISQALYAVTIPNQKSNSLQSLLLATPAELRSTIYTAALFDNDNDLFLLRTCGQTYMEAAPTLFQHPVNFSSQAKLTSWIVRSQEDDLKRVRTLSLKLVDIDMTPLFDSESSRRIRPTAWSLYQQELKNLDQALSSLTGLQHVIVVPPERNNSQLLRAMYLSFLAMIPATLPSLVRLTIHDDESLLDKIPNLREIAMSGRVKVVFDASKMPPRTESESSSRKQSTDTVKTASDSVMADGAPIKIEDMEMD